jgi:hypothetical protein
MSKTPKVPQKFMDAWELMAREGMALEATAKIVGLGSRQLRGALNAPHVRRWLREQRLALLESINATNPEALRRIRDAEEGNQMAQVAAIKTLESMRETLDPTPASGAATPMIPGLIVQIVHSNGSTETIGPQPTAPMIEHRACAEDGS